MVILMIQVSPSCLIRPFTFTFLVRALRISSYLSVKMYVPTIDGYRRRIFIQTLPLTPLMIVF